MGQLLNSWSIIDNTLQLPAQGSMKASPWLLATTEPGRTKNVYIGKHKMTWINSVQATAPPYGVPMKVFPQEATMSTSRVSSNEVASSDGTTSHRPPAEERLCFTKVRLVVNARRKRLLRN